MPNAKVIALTGSTGFIGSHILKSLLANDFRVRILVRNSNKAISHPNIEVISGDLHNQSSLDKLTVGVDCVIHCAGRVRGANAATFIHDNVHATKNILSTSIQTHKVRFILISSLSAREPSISDYANSKYCSESALKQSHLSQWTIIRPPAVYGPGDTELKPVFDWMKRGVLWVPGSEQQRFSLLHVADLSQLIIDQLDIKTEYKFILEPDDGKQYSWQLVQHIGEDFFHRKIRMIRIPTPLLSFAAHSNVLLSKLSNRSPMLTPGKVRELLHNSWVSESTPSNTNWNPKIDLKIGLGTLYSRDEDNQTTYS
jgi:2-alkyl-3-oxoalkanoate reductase